MKVLRIILIPFLIIIPFELVFSQDYQLGFHLGLVDFYESDKYLEKIIDGPYEIFDHNYFDSGYVFNKNSFSSKTDINIGLSFEYKLSKIISSFVNFTYFNITSTGDCHVTPLFSGGLADQDARFEIKSNFYIVQLGTNLNYKTRYLVPFLSFKIIYNRIQNNDVELLDVNEDFIKYSHKYTFDTIDNMGLGLGFGIKIPLTKKLYFSTKAEYDNLNLINSDVNKSLKYYNYSIGILFQK